MSTRQRPDTQIICPNLNDLSCVSEFDGEIQKPRFFVCVSGIKFDTML